MEACSSSSSSEEDTVLEAVVAAVAHAEEYSDTSNVGGGSSKGRRANFRRGQCSWWSDYLCDNPIYRPWQFRRRFRVPLKLFRRLLSDIPTVQPSLAQKFDALGRTGATSWQKILSSLRRLGDGVSFQSLDDQARMSPESLRKSFKSFIRAVRVCYGDEFLNRPPTLEELRALEGDFAAKLLPGCIGSVGCMNISWKNCPKSWKGQYHNPKNGKLATIAVEAMCDSDLYCWHVFCGRPGTNNDITVAECRPLFLSILSGERRIKLPEGYAVNGVQRDWFLYDLTDGIYAEWAIFVRPNHAPLTLKEKALTKVQEGRRKDVERLFGVLQGRFQISRHDFHHWRDTELIEIVQVCVILHNMLVRLRIGGELDDELDENCNILYPNQVVEEFYYNDSEEIGEHEPEGNSFGQGSNNLSWLQHFLGVDKAIRNRTAHGDLNEALASHIWEMAGDRLLAEILD